MNLKDSVFKAGLIYRRSLIHDEYGGNRQSGISVSTSVPFIFIFSGKSGHQHGYKDQWENKNVFSYTGEGQIGDMDFSRGNLAIRDHLKTGRRIFLFTQEAKAFVTFEGELELLETNYFLSPDREGKERVAIKFFFKRAGVHLNYQIEEPVVSLLSDPVQRTYINTPNITERKGLVTSRVGQGAYRSSILYRWEYKCAVTNYEKHEILIASHIVAWKDANNDERLDVHNGILLSPNYDALFDKHLISFENNGKIILSEILKNSDYQKLGVDGNESIKNLSSYNHEYLDRHRQLL
jgi:5-methylcytosine-specific restriction protein A